MAREADGTRHVTGRADARSSLSAGLLAMLVLFLGSAGFAQSRTENTRTEGEGEGEARRRLRGGATCAPVNETLFPAHLTRQRASTARLVLKEQIRRAQLQSPRNGRYLSSSPSRSIRWSGPGIPWSACLSAGRAGGKHRTLQPPIAWRFSPHLIRESLQRSTMQPGNLRRMCSTSFGLPLSSMPHF